MFGWACAQEGALLRTMTRLSSRQQQLVYYGNEQCRCVMSRYHKCIVALAVCVPYNNPNRAIGPEAFLVAALDAAVVLTDW